MYGIIDCADFGIDVIFYPLKSTSGEIKKIKALEILTVSRTRVCTRRVAQYPVEAYS